MMRDILTVIKYELVVMKRSSRIWLAAGLYAAAGLIAGLIYVLSVRAIEQQAMKLAVKQGSSAYVASQAVDAMGSQAYRKLIEFFAGDDGVMIDALSSVPPILLFAFWATLTFMPFFLVLFSFDQMAGDVQYRSVSFPLLRVGRATLFAGKLATQVVLYLVLVVLLNSVLFGMGLVMLTTFDVTAALIFQLKAYLLLIPFGLCYLALIAMWSSLSRSPFIALLASFVSMSGLWVISLLDHLKGFGSPWPLVACLSWLSPTHWEKGLWSPHPTTLGYTVAIYLGFAALFGGLGLLRFTKRDL